MRTWARCERVLIVTLYAVVFWAVLPACLVGCAWWLDGRLGWSFYPGQALGIMGAAIALISALLLAVAVRQYWRATGNPPVSAYPSAVLLEQGLYGYWRHPIYTFFTGIFAGTGLAWGSMSLLLVVLPIFVSGVLLYSAWEERGLERRFGARFRGHRERTGIFVPRLVRCMRPICWALGKLVFRYQVVHRERLPIQGPYFVLAAHRSYLDPVFVSLALRDPVKFVTTYEMFRTRWRAWLFRRLFALPLRRFTPDPAAVRSVIRSLEEGWVVGIFPEGERSWTGELGPLKSEAVKLLRRHSTMKIVVLRVDGNALVWPRWRGRLGRAPVRVTVESPILASEFASCAALEARLGALLRPDDTALHVSTARRAAGIGRVLYRCPVCEGRLPVLGTAESRFDCPRCAASFALGPDHRVRFSEQGRAVDRTIGEIYRAIRLRPDDVSAQTGGGPERRVCRGAIRVADTRGSRFGPTRPGTLALDGDRLVVPEAGIDWDLGSIGSVTVEGNDRLQVYSPGADRLLELVPHAESALYCQDLLLLRVAKSRSETEEAS
jgi:1-acyl-sn-glycerol-3-phosphate acyltransferase